MLNVTHQCVISPASGERALLPSGTLDMCFYDIKARHKASMLTATRKLESIFSLPSLPFGSTFISRMAGVLSPLLR